MSAAASASATQRISDKARRIEICSRQLASDAFQGGVQSRFRGRGMDFDELREYEPGDDVRAIDWNASAGQGARSSRSTGRSGSSRWSSSWT